MARNYVGRDLKIVFILVIATLVNVATSFYNDEYTINLLFIVDYKNVRDKPKISLKK